MIPKEFDLITKDDIDALIHNKIPEGRTIEYKEHLPGGADEERREFLSDVSSFANAAGGDLIFGIREKRDENDKATGIPETAPGLAGVNPDAEKRRYEDILRASINPRIPSLRVRHIDGFTLGPIILLRIQKSWAAPHMVIFKNLSRFFTRTSAGKHQLDVREIRAAFFASENIRAKVKQLRDGRLARILADETVIKLKAGPKIILHMVPLNFTDPTFMVDMLSFVEQPFRLRPLSAVQTHHRINIDVF